MNMAQTFHTVNVDTATLNLINDLNKIIPMNKGELVKNAIIFYTQKLRQETEGECGVLYFPVALVKKRVEELTKAGDK